MLGIVATEPFLSYLYRDACKLGLPGLRRTGGVVWAGCLRKGLNSAPRGASSWTTLMG